MHILIVDDEVLARQRLRTLLNAPGSDPHIVDEAASTAEVLARLDSGQTPLWELVLLDIHMPGADGLRLAQHLRALATPPAVVFVSAHSEHALRAFELDAVDYLTKPVRQERLQQALLKAERNRASGPLPTEGPALALQHRGHTERLPLREVLYFKAEQKYVTVRTATHSYLWEGTLNELESNYAAQFVRIHRNALVARWAMRALDKHSDAGEGETWTLRLHGTAEALAVSRRQLSAVREALLH